MKSTMHDLVVALDLSRTVMRRIRPTCVGFCVQPCRHPLGRRAPLPIPDDTVPADVWGCGDGLVVSLGGVLVVSPPALPASEANVSREVERSVRAANSPDRATPMVSVAPAVEMESIVTVSSV